MALGKINFEQFLEVLEFVENETKARGVILSAGLGTITNAILVFIEKKIK